jgi:hypothetical protein
LAVAITFLAKVAAADEPTPADRAAAQSLFDEASALYKAHDYHAACEKFAASARLDPQSGTLLDVGECREREGMTASAWAAYNLAIRVAVAAKKPDREAFARKRVEELTPKLARVRIQASREARVSGLVVKIDGIEAKEASWNSAVPIDPGKHLVHASVLAGEYSFDTTFEAEPSKTVSVVIPPPKSSMTASSVVAVTPASPTPRPTETTDDGSESRRTLAFVLGGAGIVALGAGAYFGVTALNNRSDAEKASRAGNADEGQRLNDRGETQSWIANATIGGGIILAGLGTWLFLTSGPAQRTSVAPVVTPHMAGAGVSSSF